MSAYCRPAAFGTFAKELSDVNSTRGLFRAAFAIALHERPDADVERGQATIAELAETVRGRVRSPSPQARIAHLHDVLFDVVGFRGNVDDYYNPANSYLPDVLATHRGLPITLVLVYKCVAEQVGLAVRGINAPGHFLAAVECVESGGSSREGGDWMFVDPFYDGEVLNPRDVQRRIADTTGRDIPDATDLLRPATHAQWLARILQNLQAIFAQTGRERDLYAMQELQELLATRS
jgi:regulator of sirC expression with transglutaminase-like and TPR domain